MSTSYSEISSAAAISQNYEKMDVGEDMMDDERDPIRNRPDSLYDPYEIDGQCKYFKRTPEQRSNIFPLQLCLMTTIPE